MNILYTVKLFLSLGDGDFNRQLFIYFPCSSHFAKCIASNILLNCHNSPMTDKIDFLIVTDKKTNALIVFLGTKSQQVIETGVKWWKLDFRSV